VRVRARVATRLGQVVLDDVSVFVIEPDLRTDGGDALDPAGIDRRRRDARRATGPGCSDAQVTDTATVGGDLTMTMNDGSGPVTVVLDRAADVGFRAPFPPGEYQSRRIGST
jgi:hypothetical protein